MKQIGYNQKVLVMSFSFSKTLLLPRRLGCGSWKDRYGLDLVEAAANLLLVVLPA